jgi:tetratricopeptide (TPR) repeat protein
LLTSALVAMLMQVGPNPSIQPGPAIPEELRELRRRQQEAAQVTVGETAPDRLTACLARADADSTAAVIEAGAWVSAAEGADRAFALHCRAYAEAVLGQWLAAARTFDDARALVPDSDRKYRARLGAMAGNAFLTHGEMLPALTTLDAALADAEAAGFTALSGEIELDRARVFVGLGDLDQAGTALASARRLIPLSSSAWLLSATLARRADMLTDAQSFIMQARTLDPTNPDILLEAGVIAILSGNEEEARTSWEAIVAAPAATQAARDTARAYLAQLEG